MRMDEISLRKMGKISEQIIQEYSPINVGKEMYEGFKSLFDVR